MSKIYTRTEIIDCLTYMDMYPVTGQHREGAAIIRQLMLEIEDIERECENRIQAAFAHVESEVKQ